MPLMKVAETDVAVYTLFGGPTMRKAQLQETAIAADSDDVSFWPAKEVRQLLPLSC